MSKALSVSQDHAPTASGESRASIIEACAKICESIAETFLSPKYAANQPMGSFCERFACEECAKAIRELAIEAEAESQVGMEPLR